jgi:hypothetical protein
MTVGTGPFRDEGTAAAATGAVFRISLRGLRRRTRHQLFAAALSLLLVVLIVWAHGTRPQTYNDVLLWSVLGFVVLINVVGYARHRRYRRLAQRHQLRVAGSEVRFETGEEHSVLHSADIAAIRVFRKRGGIGHIQIRRTDERGIRLEDYEDMEGLVAALKPLVPTAHWEDGSDASSRPGSNRHAPEEGG